MVKISSGWLFMLVLTPPEMHVCCEEVAEEANAEAFLTSHLNPLSQYGCEEGEGQEGNMKYSAPQEADVNSSTQSFTPTAFLSCGI